MQKNFKGEHKAQTEDIWRSFFQSPFCITIPFLIGFIGFSI